MELLPKDTILKFNPTTLSDVRKEYNLDKPGRMDEAIDILEDWVKKQPHFEKKDFSREYLEKTLISAKGLSERAKTKLDRLCTFKTLLPRFFEIDKAKTDFPELKKIISHGFLPKMTRDHLRVYFYRVNCLDADPYMIFSYYKYIFSAIEYLKKYDYNAGFIIIMDFSNINIMNFVVKLNLVDLQQALTVLIEGYGLRIKAFHFISPSKAIDLILAIAKQILSEKLKNRIHVHKTADTLYKYVEKEILPKEYGGKERSLKELHDACVELIISDEHMDYMKMMKQAKTNESYRQKDQFNEIYVGMPGSFRSLSVD